MTFIQFMTLFFFNLTICGSNGYDLGNDVSFSTSELCYEYFLSHDSMSLSDFYLIANRAMVINGVNYSSDELVYSDKLLEEWKKYCTANGITYTDPVPLPKTNNSGNKKPDENKGNSFTSVSAAGTFFFEDDEDDDFSTATSTSSVTANSIPKVSTEVPPATPETTEVILSVPEPDAPEVTAPVTPWGNKPSSVKKFPVNKPASVPDSEDEDFDTPAVSPATSPVKTEALTPAETTESSPISEVPATVIETAPAVTPAPVPATELSVSVETSVEAASPAETSVEASAPAEVLAEPVVPVAAPAVSPVSNSTEIQPGPSVTAETASETPSSSNTEPSTSPETTAAESVSESNSAPATEQTAEQTFYSVPSVQTESNPPAPKADSQNYTSMGGFLFSDDDE